MLLALEEENNGLQALPQDPQSNLNVDYDFFCFKVVMVFCVLKL